MTFAEFHKTLCGALKKVKDAQKEFEALNAIVKAKMVYEGYGSVDDFVDDKDGYLWRALLCSLDEIEVSCLQASEQLAYLSFAKIEEEPNKEKEDEFKH